MRMTAEQMQDLVKEQGSIRKAAEYAGVAESTYRHKMGNNTGMRINKTFFTVKNLEDEIVKLKQRVSILSGAKPRFVSGKSSGTRIIAIGDTHDQPGMNKDRFKWMARHCREVMPDRIIQIGDFCSFDSVSAHETLGSLGHASRPSFKADLESCEEAMCYFYKELGDLNIPMELTAGNHEDRITRYENKNPETVSTMYTQFEELCARYRWRLHAYGQWLFVDGVGFTHAPKNIMGKPYGGANSENQIANHATHSIVYGHTHRSAFRKAPKIGVNNSIEILNLGSAMPEGYIAKYAGTATTGWSYGIFDLVVKNGHIVSHQFISMDQLGEKYG